MSCVGSAPSRFGQDRFSVGSDRFTLAGAHRIEGAPVICHFMRNCRLVALVLDRPGDPAPPQVRKRGRGTPASTMARPVSARHRRGRAASAHQIPVHGRKRQAPANLDRMSAFEARGLISRLTGGSVEFGGCAPSSPAFQTGKPSKRRQDVRRAMGQGSAPGPKSCTAQAGIACAVWETPLPTACGESTPENNDEAVRGGPAYRLGLLSITWRSAGRRGSATSRRVHNPSPIFPAYSVTYLSGLYHWATRFG